MMKLRIIPIMVIPLLFSMNKTYAVEIYNKDNNSLSITSSINSAHVFSNHKTQDGDLTSLNLDLKGETHITENLKGYAKWQYYFGNKEIYKEKDMTPLGSGTRLGFFGFQYGNFGSLDYGRNIGLMNQVSSYTNTINKFRIDRKNSAFLFGRSNNLLTYRNKSFFGLISGFDFSVQYQGKSSYSLNRSASIEATGEGYAILTSYKYQNIILKAAFSNVGRTDAQNKLKYGRGDKAQSWGTSLRYDSKNLRLGFTYVKTMNATPLMEEGFANKANTMSFLAQYRFNNTFKPSIIYSSSIGYDIETAKGRTNLHKYLALGTSYNLTEKITLYAEYQLNLHKNPQFRTYENENNVASMGLNYKF